MNNEFSRRLRGRVRQSRKILYSELNNQIDLALNLIRTNLVSHAIAKEGTTEPFRLLIMASTFDLPLAFCNIKNMKRLYGERISGVTVVTQEYPISDIQPGIEFLTDGELLRNQKVIDCLKKFGTRASWMRQQYIKSLIVHQSEMPVLILDADTFLVKPLVWHSENHQLLLLNPADYHAPYTTHASKFLSLQIPSLNFVVHTQLQDPKIVNQIYSSDFDSGWIRWAETSRRFGEDSPASEFQTYGAYLTSCHREKASLFIPDHLIYNGESVTLKTFMQQVELLDCDLVTIGNKTKMKL